MHKSQETDPTLQGSWAAELGDPEQNTDQDPDTLSVNPLLSFPSAVLSWFKTNKQKNGEDKSEALI